LAFCSLRSLILANNFLPVNWALCLLRIYEANLSIVKISESKLNKLGSKISIGFTLLFIVFVSLAFLELIRPIQAYHLICFSFLCVLCFSVYLLIKNNFEIFTSQNIIFRSIKGQLVFLFYVAMIGVCIFNILG